MTLTDDDLLDILGAVGFREYQNSPDWAQPKVRDWAAKLRNLTDAEFTDVAESAIHDSALAMQFRGNWEADHCKASACYHEGQRRHVAAGHAEDCHGDTLYSVAYRRVGRSQGIGTRDPSRCSCSADS